MNYFKIKNIAIKHRGVLAPMQEYTHLPFRLLCKQYNAGLLFTEMVSTRHILEYKDNLGSLDLLSSLQEDTPCAVQIFGDFSEKEITLNAAHLLDSYKHFDIIDLNLGCPSLKIINSKSGSYNLKQLDKIMPIIKEISSTCKKPITLKTRLGFSEIILDSYFNRLMDTGISAITVHGRLATENYSHASRIDFVKTFLKDSKIPIIYNGDVSALTLSKLDDFEGLMVGREAMGNPFIFKQIDHYSKNKIILEKEDSFKEIDLFLELAKKHPISFSKLKVSLIPFFKNKIGSSRIREKLSSLKDFSEIKELLDTIKER